MKYFEYFAPTTVSEALMLIRRYNERASILAGGTDLLVSLKKSEKSSDYIINLKRISGLSYVDFNETDGLKIGTLSTLHSIARCINRSPLLQGKFGLLATACNKVGTPQIRNMGTIGGNICQAGPSQDTPPTLLVLDARLKMVSLAGERLIPIDEFFVAPFKTAMAEGEILTEIQIPTPPVGSAGCYQWRTKISAVDETLVGVAVMMTLDSGGVCKNIRIALCSVAPIPFRAKRTEELLRDKEISETLLERAGKTAAEETRPRSKADYRSKLSGVLVRHTIDEVWKKIRTNHN